MTSNVIKPADIREVAVIGLGLMGSGIAELVARSGRRVVAIEINQGFLDQGMARLTASLDRAVSRGKLTDTARAEIMARIRPTDDIAAGVADADLVIEAIPERMELKRTLYAQLDDACRADAILATNTSSLSVTEIAGGTRDPARVAGLHFFNPAPVMKLVEVISTVLTSPETSETLALLARDLRKTPSRSATGPGSSSTRCCCPTSTMRSGCWKRAGHARGHRQGGHRGPGPADGAADPARPDRPGHVAGGAGGAPGGVRRHPVRARAPAAQAVRCPAVRPQERTRVL